jgi:predicted membrane-bound dolichyl-phosphate-mannose-protein mannosyltransferase
MTLKYVLAALVCTAFAKISTAQVIDENAGKTYYYYDSATHKKVKEIFHHKQVVKIMPDPNNHGSYIDTFMYVKNGPYTAYDEQGHLICSGYYTQEKKDSIWKYYNAKGELLKTERYKLGALVK